MMNYYHIQDLVYQAEHVEQQVKRRQANSVQNTSNIWRRPQQKFDDVGTSSKMATSNQLNGSTQKEASKSGVS